MEDCTLTTKHLVLEKCSGDMGIRVLKSSLAKLQHLHIHGSGRWTVSDVDQFKGGNKESTIDNSFSKLQLSNNVMKYY